MAELSVMERKLRKENFKMLMDKKGGSYDVRVHELVEFIADGVVHDTVRAETLRRRGACDADIAALLSLHVLKPDPNGAEKFKVATNPLGKQANQSKPAPEREPLAAWAASHADPVPVAPEERAFEVFHDEHRGRFKDGLFSGVPQTEAGVVRLDPEVEDYIAHPGADGAIAIIENRGTFQSLKRLLVARGEVALYGERIAGVVYKSGRPTSSDLANLYRAYGLPAVKPLLYWGDIDRSGARELLSMRSRADGGNPIPAIRPWTGAYRAQASCGLSDFYNGLDLEPAADAGIDIASVEAAAGAMVDGDARLETFVLATLHLVRRIPQETLSFTDFMRDAVPLDPARKAD